MIVLPLPNTNYLKQVSQLAEVVNSDSSSIELYNASSVNKGKKIVIGARGDFNASLHTITDVKKNKVYITPSTRFSYNSDVPVLEAHFTSYMAEISYDGKNYVPLAAGPINYDQDHILIDRVPYYPSADAKAPRPLVRYRYVASITGADQIEATEWFETDASPYTNTIVGSSDDTRISIQALLDRANFVYFQNVTGKKVDPNVWIMWFNECLKENHQMINQIDPSTDLEHFQFTAQANIRNFLLPFRTTRILSVLIKAHCQVGWYKSDYIPLKLKSQITRIETNTCNCAVCQTVPNYDLGRASLTLSPAFATDTEIIIQKTAEPKKFTLEASSVEIDPDFEMLFVWYAVLNQAGTRNKDVAKFAAARYADEKRRLLIASNVNPRNAGHGGDNVAALSETPYYR